jgi:hypothetical protein
MNSVAKRLITPQVGHLTRPSPKVRVFCLTVLPGRITRGTPFSKPFRWNAELHAVEFGVEIGEDPRVGRVSRAGVATPTAGRSTPERCVEAHYLQRTRFAGIAERKLRRRRLTEDGNVEISGRDLALAARIASPRRAANYWTPVQRQRQGAPATQQA